MRDGVPSASYSSVCNVLRQWSISLIPTYRIYRLYDRVLFELSNDIHFVTFKTICGGIRPVEECELSRKVDLPL